MWVAPNGASRSRSPLKRLSTPSHWVSAPQYTSSSGSHTSGRPPPKPKVLKPIDSSATLPVRIKRSAQEMAWPYFCLIGHSRRRDLSMLTLSGQLLSGAKRSRPPVLRVGHQLAQVALQRSVVELFERLGVVEARTQRIGLGRMRAQQLQVQLVRPPVLVRGAAPCSVFDRALGFS